MLALVLRLIAPIQFATSEHLETPEHKFGGFFQPILLASIESQAFDRVDSSLLWML